MSLSLLCVNHKNMSVGVSVYSGDVPWGDRGDPGRDRAVSVHPSPGAALQTDRSLYLQPSLPGKHHSPLCSNHSGRFKNVIILRHGSAQGMSMSTICILLSN